MSQVIFNEEWITRREDRTWWPHGKPTPTLCFYAAHA